MTGHPEAGPSLFPTLPWGRLDPREHREPYLVLAEAWRHRCADTMPDSAQSHLDSMADAETLRPYLNTPGISADALRFVQPHDLAVRAAHAAFQACPGLKP